MKPEQLSNLKQAPQILDVRLADDYAALHTAGATNNCVLEVDFVKRLPDSAPEKSRMTVVYGADGESREAYAAFGKLLKHGYSDVHILEGGIEGAIAASVPLVQGEPLPEAPARPSGDILIDLNESRVEWSGRNLLNKHYGTVALSGGVMRFEDGSLKTAEFSIDLKSIECADLEGGDLHDVLVAHLHSDDFFDLENHPEATFVITKVEPIAGAKAGAPNLHLTGGLTLRGQTHPIEFDAVSGLTPEGKPAAQAVFNIDRTRWGVLYGSGKFFKRLAGHLVNDLIGIDVKIVGK